MVVTIAMLDKSKKMSNEGRVNEEVYGKEADWRKAIGNRQAQRSG